MVGGGGESTSPGQGWMVCECGIGRQFMIGHGFCDAADGGGGRSGSMPVYHTRIFVPTHTA